MSRPLPHDIWLNIAAYVSPVELQNLYTVNAALFQIALDTRYRQISIIYSDHRLLRTLLRLKDPYIAHRVRILHIYPGFLRESKERDSHASDDKTDAKEKEKEKPSIRVRLADIAHQLYTSASISRCHSVEKFPDSPSPLNPYDLDLPPRQCIALLREQLKTPQDIMHAVIGLLRGLPGLTDYYVTWHGLPSLPLPGPDPLSSSSFFSSDTDTESMAEALTLTNLTVPCIATPFLTSATLTKLSLDISLENAHALCTGTMAFHNAPLEEVSLHLHFDRRPVSVLVSAPGPVESSENAGTNLLNPNTRPNDLGANIDPDVVSCHISHTLSNRLAPALSHLSKTLKILSLSTQLPLDLAPLFDGITKMDKLGTLVLMLPIQRPHWGENGARALKRFFYRQRETVRILKIRAVQCEDPGVEVGWNASPGAEWMWRRLGPGPPDPWSLTEWVQKAFGSLEEGEVGNDPGELGLNESMHEGDVFEMDNLETLEINSALVPLEMALYCVKRFASSRHLEKVALAGGFKSWEVVKEIVGVLGCGCLNANAEGSSGKKNQRSDASISTLRNTNEHIHLRILRLGPIALSPQLLDMLAAHLPHLEHLELIIKYFLPVWDEVPVFDAPRTRSGLANECRRGNSATSSGKGSSRMQLDDQLYEFLETMARDWAYPRIYWPSLKTITFYTEAAGLVVPWSSYFSPIAPSSLSQAPRAEQPPIQRIYPSQTTAPYTPETSPAVVAVSIPTLAIPNSSPLPRTSLSSDSPHLSSSMSQFISSASSSSTAVAARTPEQISVSSNSQVTLHPSASSSNSVSSRSSPVLISQIDTTVASSSKRISGPLFSNSTSVLTSSSNPLASGPVRSGSISASASSAGLTLISKRDQQLLSEANEPLASPPVPRSPSSAFSLRRFGFRMKMLELKDKTRGKGKQGEDDAEERYSNQQSPASPSGSGNRKSWNPVRSRSRRASIADLEPLSTDGPSLNLDLGSSSSLKLNMATTDFQSSASFTQYVGHLAHANSPDVAATRLHPHRHQSMHIHKSKRHTRRNRRSNKHPTSSFGSVSSIGSGMSSVEKRSMSSSTIGSEICESLDPNACESARGRAGVTLEVALAEVLRRCFPDVQIVR